MSRAAVPFRPLAVLAPRFWVRALQDYLYQSSQPLTSLVFIFPALILYEFATRWAGDSWQDAQVRVLAFSYLRGIFSLFGATGPYLPALAVVGILICWHIFSGDPWRLHLGTAMGMAGESMLLAIPLLVLSMLMGRFLPLAAAGRALPLSGGLFLAMGAGVYEELFFRLIALTLLNILLLDIMKMDRKWGMVIIIGFSAVAFSAYHYLGTSQPPFRWSTFLFRTAAGAYFSLLFIHRGFGVTAGSHTAYDAYCFVLEWLRVS